MFFNGLLRQRGEVVERTFAHLCETGGGRRVTVRGTSQVAAWYQPRAAAHNLSLILRTRLGTGQPRGFSAALLFGRAGGRLEVTAPLPTLTHAFSKRPFVPTTTCVPAPTFHSRLAAKLTHQPLAAKFTAFSTGC